MVETIFSMFLAAASFILAWDSWRGCAQLPDLARESPEPVGQAPSVSVVVAARNEAAHLEPAVRSMAALVPAPVEIRVVNDRSSDDTGRTLERLAAELPTLVVEEVTALPPGWIGKNYALHLGAAKARGEFLLFTDADVVMDPTALARALGVVRREGLDHLAVAPSLFLGTALFHGMVAHFTAMFAVYTRPWKARDPKSRAHVGVGAFNLVRRSAYEAVGGHSRIRFCPVDDLKLGKILKDAGFQQALALGRGFIRVPWYPSLSAMVKGLMKNVYAGAEYSLARVLAMSLWVLFGLGGPWVRLWSAQGLAPWFYGASIGLTIVTLMRLHRLFGFRRAYAWGYPVAALFGLYVLWQATVLTLWRGGITWRDTFYPLKDLRQPHP